MQREGALITEQIKNLRLDDVVLSSIDTNALLSDCVKSSGGFLTSDLALSGCALKIYGGNYMQTSGKDGAVYNFSGKNSFIQAEEAWNGAGTTSYGPAVTGCKGFAVIAVRPETGEIKLSGDLSQLESFIGTPGWSYSFCEYWGTSCVTILGVDQTEVSAGWVKASGAERIIAAASAMTEESCIWRYNNDDNALYYPPDPTVGNLIIYNFYGNHAEGGSVKAIGKYSHAEGRGTVADVRYSHAEGAFTYAGGMAAHAEGYSTRDNPVVSMGAGSHAEGQSTKALGSGAHAEGQSTKASGQAAHAEGRGTIAAGECSHAAGQNAQALSAGQFVWSGVAAAYTGSGKGAGAFCINPAGGLNGFYIGDKSLEQHLIDKGAATIKADMKAALSGVFAGITDPEDVEFGKVAAALSAIWLKVR